MQSPSANDGFQPVQAASSTQVKTADRVLYVHAIVTRFSISDRIGLGLRNIIIAQVVFCRPKFPTGK
jgi:hypothetical protein